MTKFASFLKALSPTSTIVQQYASEEDPEIRWFVWLINVGRRELCATEDCAIDLALSIYGDAPLPFIIGVATEEKTAALFGRLVNEAPSFASSFQQAPSFLTAPTCTVVGRGSFKTALAVAIPSRANRADSLALRAPASASVTVGEFRAVA